MPAKSNPEARLEIEITGGSWTKAAPAIVELLSEAAILALDGARGAVAVRLADNAAVRDLNRRHRRRDKATNVLAFPAPAGFPDQLGDIVLAYETVAAEAGAQNKAFADHARHLVVHGILHLRGLDHDNEQAAAAMEARERAILARLGIADPYL